jgi:hypothetical protein
MTGYPMLTYIDRLRTDGGARFADRPRALDLERHARRLTGEYWGDAVWLTGRVPAASLQTVVAALEHLS